MARFDVYRNPSKQTREDFPYLLDVQADLFSNLGTRVVVPLMKRASMRSPLTRLNPALSVEGKALIMVTTDIAGVSAAALGPRVSSLAAQGSDIIGAIDFLLTGA